jgi:hypothetical protein
MLGVMVDLGLDWWVMTLIASVVAVAATAALLFAARPALRAVAAALAIEAVAIAVVAPFVMETSSSTSAMSASEFASRADANCAALYKVFAAAGNPSTPEQIGANLDRIIPAFWYRVAAQGTLVPPPNERRTAARWMSAMSALGAGLEALGRAANNHDAAGVKAAGARVSASTALSTKLSKQLGLKVCFS